MTDFNHQRDRLIFLFGQTPGFVAIGSGPLHVFEFANRAYEELVGHRDLIGKAVRQALPELTGQGIFEILDEVYSSGTAFVGHDVSMSFKKFGGQELTEVVVDFIYQPLFDDEDNTIGIFVQGRDITRRVSQQTDADRLRELLENSSKKSAMESLGATIAHELNQPLTVIANDMRAARRFLAQPTPVNLSEINDILLDTESAALRAGEIMRRLRDTVSRGLIRKRPESLTSIVHEVIGISRTRLLAEKVRVEVAIPEDIVVLADRLQIQQVLLNLINNACDALNDAGTRLIVIDANAFEGFARICVRDSGAGIAAEVASKAFELLFTTKMEGLGLGLGICRSIVDAHGGAIWFDKNFSSGASVCFSLQVDD